MLHVQFTVTYGQYLERPSAVVPINRDKEVFTLEGSKGMGPLLRAYSFSEDRQRTHTGMRVSIDEGVLKLINSMAGGRSPSPPGRVRPVFYKIAFRNEFSLRREAYGGVSFECLQGALLSMRTQSPLHELVTLRRTQKQEMEVLTETPPCDPSSIRLDPPCPHILFRARVLKHEPSALARRGLGC
ncbi:hypothetical protein EVAR_99303_1 [Eumeta japonica]|uniref:Uncharacterized protein n=1 Tax=Eumeta variegata TaxID=151549 RepID=A0A4C1YTI3_EUMVA|nr:hypothetical protein EVAR_99303_1 [Eumeta japonica]